MNQSNGLVLKPSKKCTSVVFEPFDFGVHLAQQQNLPS